MTRSARILASVAHEVKANPPKVLAKTRRKYGKARAEAQRKAIILNKARRAGAHV